MSLSSAGPKRYTFHFCVLLSSTQFFNDITTDYLSFSQFPFQTIFGSSALGRNTISLLAGKRWRNQLEVTLQVNLFSRINDSSIFRTYKISTTLRVSWSPFTLNHSLYFVCWYSPVSYLLRAPAQQFWIISWWLWSGIESDYAIWEHFIGGTEWLQRKR